MIEISFHWWFRHWEYKLTEDLFDEDEGIWNQLDAQIMGLE